MEEQEVPIEQVHEDIHHHSHGRQDWVLGVALTTALLAVCAAIAAMLAGHYANESMLEQMQASNQWNYYQAKSVKENVLRSKLDLLEAFGKPTAEKDLEKIRDYKREQEEIRAEADQLTKESGHHMHLHSRIARSVTLFQVAIGVSAISVLTKRRVFWYAGILAGIAGLALLGMSFV
jgi:hypothetical protein